MAQLGSHHFLDLCSTWRSRRCQQWVVLGINAYMLLILGVIQEGEGWTPSVSTSLALIKATCADIEDKLEVDPQFSQVMVHLSH